jgi:hypothetical protein
MGAVFKIEALIWVSFWRPLKFQPFSWKLGFNPRRQSKNIEMKYITHIRTCAWIICDMIPVQCEVLRINHLIPLLVMTMSYACWFLWWAYYTEDFKGRLHFQFGFAIWRIVLREAYFEGPNRIWRALKTSILNIAWGEAKSPVVTYSWLATVARGPRGGPWHILPPRVTNTVVTHWRLDTAQCPKSKSPEHYNAGTLPPIYRHAIPSNHVQPCPHHGYGPTKTSSPVNMVFSLR